MQRACIHMPSAYFIFRLIKNKTGRRLIRRPVRGYNFSNEGDYIERLVFLPQP